MRRRSAFRRRKINAVIEGDQVIKRVKTKVACVTALAAFGVIFFLRKKGILAK